MSLQEDDKMNRYETSDIRLSEDGDFELDDNFSIRSATGNELMEQMTRVVIKTTNPDWGNFSKEGTSETFHSSITKVGADLEDLIGMENSRETAELGKTKIKNAMVRTGFFEEEDIHIEAKPTSMSTIVFFLFINSPFAENPLIYQIDLDLGFGPTVRRVS